MNPIEENYKGYFITNNGLDSGYFVVHNGMIWCSILDECYRYINYIIAREY